MALIKPIKGVLPKLHPTVWTAENAVIVGDVEMGQDCTVWFHAVIRGDVNSIRIGDSVNIQDGAIVHCTYKKADTIIGDRVSIGHRAIVHGCHIESDVLIGMGAMVMDHVYIPSQTIVAAGAVVTENMKLESGWIYAGLPAKKLKPIDDELAEYLIHRTARNYVKYASWYEE